MRLRRPLHLALALAAVCGAALPPLPALAAAPEPALDLGLEDLLKADVQTASRRAQQLRDVPAAAFVITRDDIERSGATSLPEVLRLAPGVQVARLNRNAWAVTARGYNGRIANKLLVLMDGRSLYSPLFAGVLWETEDTLLEDIERIEVLRGPAGSMWGANAVNGVINIITRQSRDTVGTMAVAGAGNEENGFGALRHGTELAGGHVRAWAKAFSRGRSQGLDGTPTHDAWRQLQVGARGDWTPGAGRRLTVSGSVFDGERGEALRYASVTAPGVGVRMTADEPLRGAHVLARHAWTAQDGGELVLQGYAQRTDVGIAGSIRERRDTFDLDLQHRLPGQRHDVMWGVGLRQSRDDIRSVNGGGFASIPAPQRTVSLASVFVQDEVRLVPQQLQATIGLRVEKSTLGGVQPQPNLRLMWTPNERQAVWTALSRAVRTPSRGEVDARLDIAALPANPPTVPLPVMVRLQDGSDVKAEKMWAFEAGYRHELSSDLSVDIAAYHNRYTSLRSTALGAVTPTMVPPQPYLEQSVHVLNQGSATFRGIEATADWRPVRGVRIQPSYTFIDVKADPLPPGADPLGAVTEVEATTPRHQFLLRAGWAATDTLRADAALRHVASLRGRVATGGTGSVPAYTDLNLRLAWQASRAVEVSLAGQNLLQARHVEFKPDWIPTEGATVGRSFYAKVKVRF